MEAIPWELVWLPNATIPLYDTTTCMTQTAGGHRPNKHALFTGESRSEARPNSLWYLAVGLVSTVEHVSYERLVGLIILAAARPPC